MQANKGDEHLQMDFFGLFANIQPLPMKVYTVEEKNIIEITPTQERQVFEIIVFTLKNQDLTLKNEQETEEALEKLYLLLSNLIFTSLSFYFVPNKEKVDLLLSLDSQIIKYICNSINYLSYFTKQNASVSVLKAILQLKPDLAEHVANSLIAKELVTLYKNNNFETIVLMLICSKVDVDFRKALVRAGAKLALRLGDSDFLNEPSKVRSAKKNLKRKEPDNGISSTASTSKKKDGDIPIKRLKIDNEEYSNSKHK